MEIIVIYQRLIRFTSHWLNAINRQLIIGCCLISIALSGCVKYDTSINFSSLNSGEIVEHIQVGEQLNSFSRTAVRDWLMTIEQRTKQAQGKMEQISDRDFKITIPFNNAQDLTNRLNLYFNPTTQMTAGNSATISHLTMEQSNFLVVVRNHLSYEIDLRSLPAKSYTASSPLDLNFSLQSPWGVSSKNSNLVPIGAKSDSDRQITWQLKPGQIDRIDAVFWLPNPLGIGAICICLITIIGYYLKYRQLPGMSN